MTVKRMDIKEFQEFGYLQEANRQFFHPLGLALEVIVNNDTGEVKLGGIWDFRDNPEGLAFADGEIEPKKAARVIIQQESKKEAREKLFGHYIQPA